MKQVMTEELEITQDHLEAANSQITKLLGTVQPVPEITLPHVSVPLMREVLQRHQVGEINTKQALALLWMPYRPRGMSPGLSVMRLRVILQRATLIALRGRRQQIASSSPSTS